MSTSWSVAVGEFATLEDVKQALEIRPNSKLPNLEVPVFIPDKYLEHFQDDFRVLPWSALWHDSDLQIPQLRLHCSVEEQDKLDHLRESRERSALTLRNHLWNTYEPPEELRFLILSSIHTNVVQYVAKSLAEGLQSTGDCKAKVLQEEYNIQFLSPYSVLGCIYNFRPSAIISIGRFRGETHLFPKTLPWFTWMWDFLPCAKSPSVIAAQEPHDRVFPAIESWRERLTKLGHEVSETVEMPYRPCELKDIPPHKGILFPMNVSNHPSERETRLELVKQCKDLELDVTLCGDWPKDFYPKDQIGFLEPEELAKEVKKHHIVAHSGAFPHERVLNAASAKRVPLLLAPDENDGGFDSEDTARHFAVRAKEILRSKAIYEISRKRAYHRVRLNYRTYKDVGKLLIKRLREIKRKRQPPRSQSDV